MTDLQFTSQIWGWEYKKKKELYIGIYTTFMHSKN